VVGEVARAVVAVGEGGELRVIWRHAKEVRQRDGAQQMVEGLLGAVLQLHGLLTFGGAHLVNRWEGREAR
jgi:hypothetical protein